MNTHRHLSSLLVLGLIGALLLIGCDSSTSPDPPNPFNPLIETLVLTPNWDSGSPLILQSEGTGALLAFTSTFKGSGEICLLDIEDSDADGLYDEFQTKVYYSTPEDSFTGPDATFFSRIGRYEYEEGGDQFPNYPGGLYFTGPRQIFYDSVSDRIFYTMGYDEMPQVASTRAPMSGDFDQSLEELYNSDGGRTPIWQFWYTKDQEPGESPYFTGGYLAAVSARNSHGDQWLAYSDTIQSLEDNDWDGSAGEDPAGDVSNDGMPGEIGVDDDSDGLSDLADLQVAAMSNADPGSGSYAWNMQNYNPIFDDDEDGLMNEDPVGDADNDGNPDDDGDGRIDEDPDVDDGDGSPGVAGVDDDGDGLSDFDDYEVRHATLRMQSFQDNGYDPAADDDEDGIHDEDGDEIRDGIWVVKISADGLPDPDQTPISLTNDGGRQPFFNPVNEEELLYSAGGDIHRATLEYETDSVSVISTVNLTESGEQDGFPAYSDNGARIVFVSSTEGSADLWTMDSDGGNKVRVTNFPGQELFPRFTPGGEQILFEAWRFPEGDRRILITSEPLPQP